MIPQPSSLHVSQLQTFRFNVWEYTADELMQFSFEMFDDLGLIDEFNITPHKLQASVNLSTLIVDYFLCN